MEKSLKAEGVRWDISDLYARHDDERLEADLMTTVEQAEKFAARYRGKINCDDLTAETLHRAIVELEAIYTRIYKPGIYAFLAFSADTADDAIKALYARCQDLMAQVQNLVLFFELEVQKIPQVRMDELLASDRLSGYRHYLEGVRLFAPYTLSEKEEQVINKKDLSGKHVFVNLFDEYVASFTWQLEVDGEMKTLTGEEMRHLLRHPDPALREKAKRAYDGRFGENAIIFTNIFNAMLKDHSLEMEMRGYQSPMAPAHLRNRIAAEVVETMMEVTSAYYHLAQEYYKLKAELLRMPKVRGCDLIAPVVEKREIIPWQEGKRLVLQAFENFSPEFHRLAQSMFDNRWIDAEVRRNKRGGAYCEGTVPQHHPYVLMSYNDDINNVYTLAHELGHALHDFFAGRKQTLFNFQPPLVAAETASVFAEMLLTRKLLAEVKERELRIAILTGKLEDLLATIHTQNYYTRFELDAHLQAAKERLSATQLCQLWTERRREMYGDAVDFLPEQQWYWAAIPHFIHTRFYCYAYTFGALLVLALFRRYEEQGESFIPRYIQLLETGGSDTPENMIKRMGFDIRHAEFWESGFRVMQSFLEELMALSVLN
ncbi:MAG: M3 family oligoendopeptidase [candidate division KSB1 bacterium]|nr:M3 family oligoendopeptidase [candidate division KSB1 bacterium]MDZ7300509.1 M3 family oligoendopeptidase [candidate division KSB1 bacterium]MDZ7309648.1 M3 family oligoendopeptidase [candidate division KSB1 bacterium]